MPEREGYKEITRPNVRPTELKLPEVGDPDIRPAGPAFEVQTILDRLEPDRRSSLLRLIRALALMPKLIKPLTMLVGGLMRRNLRTTIAAVLSAIAAILSHFEIAFPQEWFEPIIALGVLIVGVFAADGKEEKPEEPAE